MGKDTYAVAYEQAVERLRGLDPEEICASSGARKEPGALLLTYFDRELRIALPSLKMSAPEPSREEQILILHYLIGAGMPAARRQEMPGRGEYVGFKGLPGGMFYYPSFRQRALNPLLSRYAALPERVLTAAAGLGGEPEELGDVSVRVPVFPLLDLKIVLYREDEEFPPEATMLFRDDIVRFLTLEDIAYLGSLVAERLLHAEQEAAGG
jgi:hypothetical protein